MARLGPPVLAALVALAYQPLLRAPERFPSGGDPEAASRAIADALARAAWEREAGEVSHLDPDLEGRNRAADRAAFYTHPLYYALSRALPPGLSLTLTALLHGLALALGTQALARRLGFAPPAALFAGAVAVLAGRALEGMAAPGELGGAAAAALAPALAVLLLRLRERPSLPRAACVALAACLVTAGGDLPASLLSLLLACAAAWLADRQALPPAEQGPAEQGPAECLMRLSGRPSGRALLLSVAAVLLGACLPAYRTLPLALGDPAGFLGMDGLRQGPWWMGGGDGPLRLPFAVGSLTLVALAASFTGLRGFNGLCGARGLLFPALAVLFATALPRALAAFTGPALALGAAAGAARLRAVLPARIPVVLLLGVGLALEAGPALAGRLVARNPGEVTAGPRWALFLGAHSRLERAAVLGAEPGGVGTCLVSARVPRAAIRNGGDPWALGEEEAEAFSLLGASTLVADLPDPLRRYPLAHYDRQAGKYVHWNPRRRGLAYWTQRVERHPASSSGSRIAPGLVVPRSRGAITFPEGEGREDPPGEAWGLPLKACRSPNGVRVQVEVPGRAWLVFSEPLLGGMGASVDGRAASLVRANGRQPALLLEEGAHEVELRFEPPGLATGTAVSALAAALLFFLFLAPVISALAARGRPVPRRPAPSLPARRARAPQAALAGR